ncbi:response regulator transcription factor [Micromonospora okii]|uniref:response regulator transcription factor n=1 Tax=Micromonospora okii TaxID=1182970 RepID=UPI001E520D27|nr:response regulator transcription factor [Micromonospora okii]
MAKILLIDENAFHRRSLSEHLFLLGHTVTDLALHETGRALSDLACHTHQRPDVVMVDPFAPAVDGLLLMRMLCISSRRPVLVHSVDRSDDDIVQMLHAGADSYLPKPCHPSVVDACVGALLRRVPAAPPPPPTVVGSLRIDVAERSATIGGEPLVLTRTEFDLLACLAEHPGRVVPRAQLRIRVGRGAFSSAGSVDVLLHRLRRKIAERASDTRYLHTVRGKGIALHADADRRAA